LFFDGPSPSLTVGHDVLLKATSGPRHKKRETLH